MTRVNTEPVERILTPRMGGKRLRLHLSDADWRKIRRGRGWQATITDTDTGQRYRVRGAACSISTCFCDAIARLA